MNSLLSTYLSLGLRRDGRRPHEIRKIDCSLCVLKNANGSAQFTIGNTSVIVAVFGPKHAINYETRMNRSSSTLVVRTATNEFSSAEHKKLSKTFHSDRLLTDIICDTFNPIIIGKLYPMSTIEIVIEVMQNDGSLLSAMINCTTLALINAGIALKEYCVSCTAAYLDGRYLPFIDLNGHEIYGSRISKISNQTLKMMSISTTNSNLNKLHKKKKYEMGNIFVVGKSENAGEISVETKSDLDIEMNVNKNNENSEKKNVMDVEVDEEIDDGSTNEIIIDNEMIAKMTDFHGQLTLALLPVSDKIITMQMQSIIDFQKMSYLLSHCKTGCRKIHKIMKRVVKNHAFQLVERRGFVNRY